MKPIKLNCLLLPVGAQTILLYSLSTHSKTKNKNVKENIYQMNYTFYRKMELNIKNNTKKKTENVYLPTQMYANTNK